MRTRAILAALAIGIAMVAWWPPAHAAAHPLGNFTINLYSRLELYGDVVRVRYIVDMAEIPAFRERDAIDANHDGTLSADERAAYVATLSSALARGLRLTADGASLPLQVRASDLALLPDPTSPNR